MNRFLNIALLAVAFCLTALSTAFAGTGIPSSDGFEKTFVKLGSEVAAEQNWSMFKGKKLGLIVNHSSCNSKGEHLADVLAAQKLAVKLFGPEHGIRGAKDEENLKDEIDQKTGLSVISLYKSDKRAPNDEDLKGIDALVFDIQEIGVRYYTYASTMALAMKAAAKAGVEFYVLDRPNPAMPWGAFGAVLDKEFEGGFISMYPIPMTHGLTIGELAKYYNEEFGIKCKLTVVPMENYNRSLYYDQTGFPWRNPSPNIRSMDALLAYHVFGCFEMMNLSVGRGTATPFLVYGNPDWKEGRMTIDLLNLKLTGFKFDPVTFTPESSKFQGKLCKGFKVTITERSLVEPLKAMIAVASVILKQFPEAARAQEIGLTAKMIGSRKVLDLLKANKDADAIVESVEQATDPQVKAFVEKSKKYRLYQ